MHFCETTKAKNSIATLQKTEVRVVKASFHPLPRLALYLHKDIQGEGMIVAISVWNQRIAPVFDVSGSVLICLTQQGEVIREYRQAMPARDPVGKIHKLQANETEVLICGAISKNILELAEMYGMVTFPFTSGEVEAIKTAYLEGRLSDPCFARPGCRRRRRMRCQAGNLGFKAGHPFSEE